MSYQTSYMNRVVVIFSRNVIGATERRLLLTHEVSVLKLGLGLR